MTYKNVNIEEVQVHPLFTVDEDSDDDEIKTVTSIHIARKENGKLMFAPRMRRAEELTDLQQIQEEFGGGEFVLIGYNNGRISARKTINLPGRPKPLYDEGVEQTPAPANPAQSAPVDPVVAMIGGGQGGLMGLIMMMMQQMMQQQAQAAQSQTQMFIAMMQGNQQQSSEEKAAARAELQANIERERIASERTMALMREMMSARPSGDSGESFYKGVEFMRTFATQQVEMARAAAQGDGNDGLGSILETLGQAFQAAQAVGMFKGGALPEGVPTEIPEAAQ